jgi:hypothetical protein
MLILLAMREGRMDTNGDYIFYADESGDHSLTSVDPSYPAFSLSLCAFEKSRYCRRIIPDFLQFKFKHFGHDSVVLHERDIRKQTGHFKMLTDLRKRETFMDELTALVGRSRFVIFATVIDKAELKMDMFPNNPYSIALRICLQSAFRFLDRRGRQTEFIISFSKKEARRKIGIWSLNFVE